MLQKAYYTDEDLDAVITKAKDDMKAISCTLSPEITATFRQRRAASTKRRGRC